MIVKGQQVRVKSAAGEFLGHVTWLGEGTSGGIRVGVERPGKGRAFFDLAEVAPLRGWTRVHAAAMAKDRKALAAFAPEELDGQTTEAMSLQFGATARTRSTLPPGSTALHIAFAWPDAGCVRALLDAGARPDLPDSEGNLPGVLMASVHANAVVEAAAEAATSPSIGRALALAALSRGNGHALMGLARGGFDFEAPLDGGPSLRARFVDDTRYGAKRKTVLAAARSHASPDVLEAATTGKSKCQACRKKIGRGQLRFCKGELLSDGRIKSHWYDLVCAKRLFGGHDLLVD